MSSLSTPLQHLAETSTSSASPGFSTVVVFDYYDGPERGLAVYPSGEGVRFKSLGTSKSGVLRAFEFTLIAGLWADQVEAFNEIIDRGPAHRIHLPPASEAVAQLERDVDAARALGRYIAAGRIGFDRFRVSAVTDAQLKALHDLGDGPAGYELAHQIIKRGAGQP